MLINLCYPLLFTFHNHKFCCLYLKGIFQIRVEPSLQCKGTQSKLQSKTQNQIRGRKTWSQIYIKLKKSFTEDSLQFHQAEISFKTYKEFVSHPTYSYKDHSNYIFHRGLSYILASD